MRGLDPRIHLKKRCSITMDCRVKPGNDSRDRCHSRLWGGQRVKRAPPFRIRFWKDGGARRSCAMANSGKTRHCEEPTGRANARPMTGSATKQSILSLRLHGLLRFARNDELAPLTK